MATADGQVMSSYSNFVALAALGVAGSKHGTQDETTPTIEASLNGRFLSKLRTSMPDGYFGNAIIIPCCLWTAGQLIEEPISSAANKIKKTIERVTEDCVRSSLDYMDMYQYDSYSVSSLFISPWLRLDYGCIDFGWGGPRQLGTGNTPPNLCMFMREESENKKGIVVVLGLPLSAGNTFRELVQI